MRRFLARRAAAALRNLPEFVPPLEFPCRIERLPEGCSTIDNELYDDAHYSSTWHAEDTSRELATLQLLNAARIPYFDRVWRQRLRAPTGRLSRGRLRRRRGDGGAGALGYRVTGVDPAAAAIEAARGTRRGSTCASGSSSPRARRTTSPPSRRRRSTAC